MQKLFSTFLICFLCNIFKVNNVLANENLMNYSNEFNNGEIKNIKTFSGPMGMGLTKSYQKGTYKICVYNTIEGQKVITHKDNLFKCSKEFSK